MGIDTATRVGSEREGEGDRRDIFTPRDVW